MCNNANIFYFPDKKLATYIDSDYFEYVNEAKLLTKKNGYIGSGLFGEEKIEIEESKEEEKDDTTPVIEENPTKINTELIVICILSSIIGALTCLIIIKLINGRKKNKTGDFYEDKH